MIKLFNSDQYRHPETHKEKYSQKLTALYSRVKHWEPICMWFYTMFNEEP